MDPLAEELVHPQESDLRVIAGALEVGRTETAQKLEALGAEGFELRGELGAGPQVVAARLGYRRWIPGVEVDGLPLRRHAEDVPDAAREAAPLGLDEVTDTFVRAPFAWFGPPAGLVTQREQLDHDGRRGGSQQIGDAVG